MLSDWDWDWGWDMERERSQYQYNPRGQNRIAGCAKHIADCAPALILGVRSLQKNVQK